MNANENQAQPHKTLLTTVVAPYKKQQINVPPKQVTTKLKSKEEVQPQNKLEDNRFLVRLSPDHSARSLSPYAIMLQLNAFLKEKLVKQIQTTTTGFTICPASVDVQDKSAARTSEIEASFSSTGHCKVEKPGQHVAYRLSALPRTYAGNNGVSVELK